jgi:hypothetical protein
LRFTGPSIADIEPRQFAFPVGHEQVAAIGFFVVVIGESQEFDTARRMAPVNLKGFLGSIAAHVPKVKQL